MALDSKPTAWRRAGEVFLVFLKLGLTAFGGPIAHLGYFRQELVTRRRWIGELAKAAIHGLKLVAVSWAHAVTA